MQECMEKLNKLSEDFLADTLDEKETNIVNLLSEIIVVEKETICAEKLFNQLKESYFESDEATALFINKLYEYDVDTISDYLDIYIEQAYEDELTDDDINNKISIITSLIRNIKPELVILLEEKLTNMRGEME